MKITAGTVRLMQDGRFELLLVNDDFDWLDYTFELDFSNKKYRNFKKINGFGEEKLVAKTYKDFWTKLGLKQGSEEDILLEDLMVKALCIYKANRRTNQS